MHANEAGCLGLGQAPGNSSPTLQAVRLVLLLWLTRATLGVMKCCLRTAAPQHSHSREGIGSSSSREGVGSSSSREGVSSSSSREGVSSSSREGVGNSSRDGVSSSSASGGGFGGVCGVADTSSSSSWSSTANAGVAVIQKSMVALAAPLLHALVKWQKTTSELTRSSAATTLPAAAGAADVSCLTTRKRLSRLPLQGLPEAVTTQLDKCSNIWRQLLPTSARGAADNLLELPPPSVFDDIERGDIEGLQDLGQELVVLFELLLEEVPSPLGCNFPGCSNLSGFTEADEAGSVCTRCQEARYCSKQCQVDHWEQHKRACKRLKKQAEAAAAAAGGRTLEAETAGSSGGVAGKVTKASRKGGAKG